MTIEQILHKIDRTLEARDKQRKQNSDASHGRN